MEYAGSFSRLSTGEYAIGGLVGFNFGRIENCSAVCNMYGTYTERSSHIGGLVGSMNGRSTVSRSYSGGIIYADYSKNSYVSTKSVETGGISGGFYNIYGYNTERSVTISDCYSYCVLNSKNITSTGNTYAKPTVSPIAVASSGYNLTIKNCYYLTDTMTYITDKNGTDLTYDELCNLTFKDDSNNLISGKAPGYPFPAFVRKIVKGTDGGYGDYGEFVHYGDWPH